MFDIGAMELLVVVIVAVIVIGPKDMPMAMRTAGRWIGKVRRVSAHFRTGIDAMVREAELEDMEKQWKARNDEIMRQSAKTAEEEAGEPIMTGPPPIASDEPGEEGERGESASPELSPPPAGQPASSAARPASAPAPAPIKAPPASAGRDAEPSGE